VQEGPQALGNGEHPLPHRKRRQDMVDEMGGGLNHTAGITRRTCSTTGRGFWVLDDYSPLRTATPAVLASEAHIFPVKEAVAYMERVPLGLADKSFQGESYYTADNPPVGAVFTYYLKDAIETRRERRREAEKEAWKAGEPISYPSFEEMRAEDQEQDPYLLLTVTDTSGNVVRRLEAPPTAGIQRITWDFRYPPTTPVDLSPPGPPNPFAGEDVGPMVAPGTHRVAMAEVVDGVPEELVGPVDFRVVALDNAVLAAEDKIALLDFQQDAGALLGEVMATSEHLDEIANRLRYVKEGILLTPGLPKSALAQARELGARLAEARRLLQGDGSVARRAFETSPSIQRRVGLAVGASYGATSAPSPSQREQIRIARQEFRAMVGSVEALERDLSALEERMEALGAPHTPGRRRGGG
jgi:hypothetical protein